MVLNWNPLVILKLSSSFIILIAILIINFAPTTKKIHSLKYIKYAMIFIAISIFLDGISNLFMNFIITIISAIFLIPCSLSFAIGIKYTMKETYISIELILISSLGILLCYLAMQPGAVEQITEYGIVSLRWKGLFGFLSDILITIATIQLFYWGLMTWKNAPFLIKKEALLFFIGIMIATFISSLGFIFRIEYQFIIRIEYHFIANILYYGSFITGILIFIYVIIKEPKLLYVLPFTIYRILVKDKEGYLLFNHDWSESEISEIMFTGFINAVQVMSEEVMNIGGLVDINLEEGILILHEGKSITVGLVSSKSSKLLKDILLNFSKDFEHQFERELKQKIRDTSKYETAYLLIDKHFSNFPFRIIPSKRHSILLSGKYAKIPLKFDNKLKDIFTDEKEYESIKAEIIKSPLCVSEEFLNLYEDLKKEKDKLADDDSKELDNKKN